MVLNCSKEQVKFKFNGSKKVNNLKKISIRVPMFGRGGGIPPKRMKREKNIFSISKIAGKLEANDMLNKSKFKLLMWPNNYWSS